MHRPTVLSKALIAALVVSLATGPALGRPLLLPEHVSAAASGPKLLVVVVPLDGPSKSLQAPVELQLSDAVRSAGRFETLPLVDALDPVASAARQQKREAARRRVAEGQKALDDLDTAKGVEAFTDAVLQLKETDTSVTFGELVKAWVLKAAGHALGGETALAKLEIERIVAISPRAEFTPQFFSPDLIKFVEKQRALANNAKGELAVRTEPSGANVWVNGQLRGQSPVTVKGLSGAKHQVNVLLGGFSAARAELPPGDALIELKSPEQDGPWRKAVDLISKSPRTAPRDQALVALGRKLGAEQVLAVLLKKSPVGDQVEATLIRLEVRDGHNLGYATSVLPLADSSEPFVRALQPVLMTDAPRQGRKPVTHFDGSSPAESGHGRRVVGVTLLAAAAGLMIAGVATGIVGQARADEFRRTEQVRTPLLTNLRSEATVLGAISAGSFGASAISAGVGVFMLASEPGAPAAESKREPAPRRDEPPPPSSAEEPAREPFPGQPEPASNKVDPAEERRRKDEEARLRRDEEQRAKEASEAKKKETKSKKPGDAAAKAAEEDRRRAEEEQRKKDEDEKKRRFEEERRQEQEKKKDEGKKAEDHDDLRNF